MGVFWISICDVFNKLARQQDGYFSFLNAVSYSAVGFHNSNFVTWEIRFSITKKIIIILLLMNI